MSEEFATYLPGILLSYSVFLLSILSPGPNILAIMGTSMGEGRASGVALALGVASGSCIWALLTAFGLSAVLITYASAMTAIKIVGGLFLLWLAWKSLKSAASPHDMPVSDAGHAPHSWHVYFLRGLTVQMTNPKAALAWVAIISLGLTPDAPLWVAFAIVAGTVFFSIVCHLIYAIVFSTSPLIRLYTRARRWIQGVLGVFFAGAGIKLLADR